MLFPFTLKTKNVLRIFHPYILPNHKNTSPSTKRNTILIKKACITRVNPNRCYVKTHVNPKRRGVLGKYEENKTKTYKTAVKLLRDNVKFTIFLRDFILFHQRNWFKLKKQTKKTSEKSKQSWRPQTHVKAANQMHILWSCYW